MYVITVQQPGWTYEPDVYGTFKSRDEARTWIRNHPELPNCTRITRMHAVGKHTLMQWGK